VQITFATSAFVGTINFEASDDSGTTWYPVVAAREDGTGQDSVLGLSITALYDKMWIAAAGGVTHFRVRCSVFTSGTLVVRLTPGPMLIEPNPIVTAIPVDGNKATYTSYVNSFASVLTSGVAVWRLLGSATKLVKLTRLEVGL